MSGLGSRTTAPTPQEFLLERIANLEARCVRAEEALRGLDALANSLAIYSPRAAMELRAYLAAVVSPEPDDEG